MITGLPTIAFGSVLNCFKNKSSATPSLINEYYLNDPNLSASEIKRLIDFIRCNKLYEDIQIYKREYEQLVELIKIFLVDYYDIIDRYYSSLNILRNFFDEVFKPEK